VNVDVTERRAALEEICRRYYVRRLELFGSAASGRDRPGESDLDFLVDFEPLPTGAYADTYFGLQEALEALFARPVDLVVASAIKNPYFRQSVERSKVLVYG
jgi:uncharacterized protein